MNVFDNPYESLMEKLAALPAVAVDALRGGATGAALGAAGGALTGLKRDENGQRHVLRNAVVGAAMGGSALAGINASRGSLQRMGLADISQDVVASQKLHENLARAGVTVPDQYGEWTQRLQEASKMPAYKIDQHLGLKVKRANQVTGKAAPLVREALTGMSGGAALGGIGGALSGLHPDANGDRHIVRNAVVGAAGGAALGAGGAAGYGHLARAGAQRRSVDLIRQAGTVSREDPVKMLEFLNQAQQADDLSRMPFAMAKEAAGIGTALKQIGQGVKGYASRSSANAEKVIGAGVGAAIGGSAAAARTIAKGGDVNKAINNAIGGAYAGGYGGFHAGGKIGEKLRAAAARRAGVKVERANAAASSNLEMAERRFRMGSPESAEHFEGLSMMHRAKAEAFKRQADRPFGMPEVKLPSMNVQGLKERAKSYANELRFKKASKLPTLAIEALHGGAAGSIGGAAIGGLAGLRKDENGNRHVLGGALKGALVGGALGAGGGAAAGHVMRRQTMQGAATLRADAGRVGRFGRDLMSSPTAMEHDIHNAIQTLNHAQGIQRQAQAMRHQSKLPFAGNIPTMKFQSAGAQ